MKFEDFKIGEYFWTGAGQWYCVDKGTWTIVAVPANQKHTVKKTYIDCTPVVFETVDFGGCDPQDRFR